MPQTETPISQLKLNELTKTQFESASDLSETELYAVDPEFAGGKLLKTDNDGNIVESTATEEDILTGTTAIQGVQVNGVDLTPDANKKVNVQVPTNNNQLANGAGYITSSALNGYATQTWVGQQGYLTSTSLNGYATEQWVGQQGYLTGITSSDVTTALGYTPYNSSNPAGYTSNVGTVTSVNNVQPNNGNVSISIPDSTSDLTNDSGFITLSSLSGTSPISYNSNTGAISVANGYQITTTAQVTQIGTNTTNIATINSKIPNDASSSNQLADKNFVNSSISSNTANFIGTFNSVAALEAYSGTLTNNDYAFVVSQDTSGNTVYNRYKWNGTEWLFEYALNNSSFAADQWASINSTATASKISQIATNTSDISALQSGKQDNITGAATTITSSDLTVSRALVSNSSGKVGVSSVTVTELGYLSGATSSIQTQLNGKQATISDLATIRSGASAGATALQSGDNISELNNDRGYITGITSSMVTTALGYTPYNSSNPNGYITSSALSGYQTTANLVTSVSSASTDSQYPSAKCVYDIIGNIETLLSQV